MRREVGSLVVQKRRVGSWVKMGGLALLTAVGAFKAALTLPVDATLLAGGLVAICCGHEVVSRRWRVPLSWQKIGLLFAVFSLGLLLASFDGYSTSKMGRLFGLTLLACAAASLLPQSAKDLSRYFHAVTAAGLFLAIESLVSPPDAELYGRLTAFGSDTIALSRAAGIALLWVVVLAFHGRIRPGHAVVLATPLLMAMFGSGQRGPLAALFVSLLAVFIAPSGTRRTLRRATVVVLVVVAGWVAFNEAPDQSSSRLAGGAGTADRMEAWTKTFGLLVESPLGVGWGDWGDRVTTFAVASPEPLERDFPHNIFLEVAAEAGVVAGVVFVVFVARRLRSASRGRWSPEGQAVLGGLVFALMNAMVSGDINDNRLVWVMLGFALLVSSRRFQADVGNGDVRRKRRGGRHGQSTGNAVLHVPGLAGAAGSKASE
jgi:O-antigen ligase